MKCGFLIMMLVVCLLMFGVCLPERIESRCYNYILDGLNNKLILVVAVVPSP